jgi:hypothetical protein
LPQLVDYNGKVCKVGVKAFLIDRLGLWLETGSAEKTKEERHTMTEGPG